METTDPELYARLHPDRPDPRERRRCLDDLRAEGYQVGTGVLIGVPVQSLIQLARDLLFMRCQDVDMIGMGPYLPHAQTPLGRAAADFDPDRQLDLGLNMIACARLLLPDVNIAATTALQTLAADGRERGLQAGANVIMPNVTDTRYRGAYQLYQGKPHLDENSAASRGRLELAVAALGESIGYGRRGDAPRAVRRGAGLPGGPPTGSGSTDVSGSPGRW
jgi:biotin synthase